MGTRAIVVFEDRQKRSILQLCRSGFRHCFCLVGNDLAWTICDPLAARIEILPLLGFDEQELARHYSRSGRTVLLGHVSIGDERRRACLRPVSCVEIVKRVLNVDAPRVLTPFQLYRCLLAWRAPFHRFQADA